MKRFLLKFSPRLKMLVALCIASGCLCGVLPKSYAEDPNKPMRIAVFPLFAEEILIDMVGPNRIVYVGHEYLENGEAYSPTMALTESICGNNWQNCNEEYLLSLEPDLIILADDLEEAYYNHDLFPLLSDEQIAVLFVHSPENLQDIMNTISLLGKTVCKSAKANQILENMEQELSLIEDTLQLTPINKLKVVYYDAWQDTFSIVSEQCALQNLYSGKTEFVNIDDALIADWNPDIIFFNAAWLDTDGSVLSIDNQYAWSKTLSILTNRTLSKTTAIVKNRVYPINLHASHYITNTIKEIIQYAVEK